MSVHVQHRRGRRAGIASLLVGFGLAAAGFVTAPVQGKPADPPGPDHKISICHATGNGGYSNPNPTAHQILDPDGHGTHPDDIIPPFPAGSQGANSWAAFPGQNWDDAGRAIHEAGCTVPPDPGPEVCADGEVGVWPACVIPDPLPEVCADGEVGVWPACVIPDPLPEVCAQGEVGVWPACVTPDPEPEVCAQGEVGVWPACVIPDPLPDLLPQVSSVVVSPAEVTPASDAVVEQPTRLPIEVLGEQLLAAPTGVASVQAAELPRTGAESMRLVQMGLLLIMMGAGATFLGMERRRALPVVAGGSTSPPPVNGASSWLVAVVVGAALLGRRRRAN